MEFQNSHDSTNMSSPIGSMFNTTTPPLVSSMPVAGGGAVGMDSVSSVLASFGGGNQNIRRPKKVREAEKRANFYLGMGQGSTQPRYLDWATRFAHQYLHNFNTDNLHLFYDTGSTFTFINTLDTPSSIVYHTGGEDIYTYLQLFRGLKQIHLDKNGLQIQPMTDHHSITLTLELNIEHHNGSMCHVITTLILQTLPGKKTRRQIGDYQACQYIQNQFFTIVP